MAEGPRGLHDRLNRISHWDVNVSDLQRSLAWYGATTALRPVARTRADQAFPSLGIEHGRFEGVMLRDATKPAGWPMLHLVEWQQPSPVGSPYLSHANVGWFRIAVSVPDIAEGARHGRGAGQRAVHAHDRCDGAVPPGYASRVLPGVLRARSRRHHARVRQHVRVRAATGARRRGPQHVRRRPLHLLLPRDAGPRLRPGRADRGPCPERVQPARGRHPDRRGVFGVRGNATVVFDWLEWTQSHGLPTPYEAPNHLGIMRSALEVDDLDATSSSWCRRPGRNGHASCQARRRTGIWDLGWANAGW